MADVFSTPHQQGGSWPPVAWLPPTPLELQAMLPQYEITQLLGRGGMGAVYLGRQISLDRPVAIKILPSSDGEPDPNYAERFKNEARAMAKLTHPGIVAVYDFGATSSGLLFIVMEYVEGTDVQAMIHAKKRLSMENAMAITAHICDALQYAHERGIIHRDIKPANVMVGYDGAVKVADFGLAKMCGAGDAAGLTRSGEALGTLHYMAPETLTLGVAVDSRADVYAVGVMLYHMLTGKRPQGMFELPSLQIPGLDPRYDGIIARAMRDDRDLRYPSAAEMRADLDSILTHPVVKAEAGAEINSASALPAKDRPQRPDGKRQVLVRTKKISAAFPWLLVTVLALGGLVAWAYFGHRPKPPALVTRYESPAPRSILPVNEVAPVKDPKGFSPNTDKITGLLPSVRMEETGTGKPEIGKDKVQEPAPDVTPVVATHPAPVSPVPAVPPIAEVPNVPELVALQQQFKQLQAERVTGVFNADVVKLNSSYLGGLDREQTKARAAGHLDGVIALEKEKKFVAGNQPIPDADETGINATVKSLRDIYREARAKLEAARADNLTALTGPLNLHLQTLEANLTKGNRITDAMAVREYRETLPAQESIAAGMAYDGKNFTNSLGMKFVPVPGAKVFMCIHTTRVKDFAVYAANMPAAGDEWKKAGTRREMKENYPVVNVSWDDAKSFCAWLSRKEGRNYRLPTDREWSMAVGIGQMEVVTDNTTPQSLDHKIPNVFPWGTEWPPPKGAGNFADTACKAQNPVMVIIEGYTDGYAETAPVMSFKPNKLGLYDMSGNVWQWCEDWYNSGKAGRVLRGGCWNNSGREYLLSSYRESRGASGRSENFGFRCVLSGDLR